MSNKKTTIKHKTAKKILKKSTKQAVKKSVVKKVAKKAGVKTTKKNIATINKVAKRVVYAKAVPPAPELVEKLIRKGQTRGFVTETEVLYAFPEIEDYIVVYENFLDELDLAGLQVMETKEGVLGRGKELQDAMTKIRIETPSKTDNVPTTAGPDGMLELSQDSIQMY